MKFGKGTLIIISILVVLLGAFLFRGMPAVKFFLIFFVLITPLFFIINGLNFTKDESFLYSIALSAGIYPLLIFVIGITGISFTISTGIIFFLLSGVAIIMHLKRQNTK